MEKFEQDPFENYWNRSTSKAFSFDDDDDNLGGDNVGDGACLSTQSAANATGGNSKWDILNDDTISEASFDNNGAFGSALNLLSIKSIVSEDTLSVILNEQTLDDRVTVTKGMSPEDELKLLRRQIQSTLYNPSTEVTAQKLLHGKTVHLEVFKSLHEKQELLDAVLLNGGGDAVIAVLLFLRKSLNRTNFHNILNQRPKAFWHYLSYLKADEANWPDAIELLQLGGKQQEAALLQLQLAFKERNIQKRKQCLRQLLERYSGSDCGVLSLYQQIFHAAHKLLELLEQERSTLSDHTLSLDIDSSAIEVLYGCCRKHSNWKEQDLLRTISPFRLCAEQQISAAQFEWTALNERATAQAYADLESVFERTPTWHPMKQKQFHISFSLNAAIWRLHQLQAPNAVLYLFLTKMTAANEKLEMARRVKCTKAIIDALAALKDVTQLTQLRDTLAERSEEQFHCDKALKAVQTKRWSTDNIKIKL